MMMCSNGSAAFAVPAGTLESGSEFGPRVPLETLAAGYVALADGLAPGVVVLEGTGVVVEPGAGVAPLWPGAAVLPGALVLAPVGFEPSPGTAGDPPMDVPPPHAATPRVAAPAELRIKPPRVMRNRDMEPTSGRKKR
jgi:hypothetical protein